MAEIAGFDLSLNPKRRATLEHSVEDLFGGAGDQSRATFWTGLRPMTPDGTPVVGRSPVSNLFLNTGHGTLGWTMAAGSGRVLADIVSGRQTEIESADLGFARAQTMRMRPGLNGIMDVAYQVTNYPSLEDARLGRSAIASNVQSARVPGAAGSG